MLFSDIRPYIRYARFLTLSRDFIYQTRVPYDMRLFYAQKGSAKILCGSTEYEMKDGALIIIPSGVPYKLLLPEESVTYIALNFDYSFSFSDKDIPIAPDIKENFKKEKLLETAAFLDATAFNDILFIPNMKSIEKKLLAIELEYSRKMYLHEQKESAHMIDLLTDCLRARSQSGISIGKNAVKDILDYINCNFNKNITNKTVGEAFSFHPNYINDIVKKSTGMSLHKYLLYVRISNAINYLDNDSMSITEIAEKCGFCDIYYFSAYFKRIIGISPKEYRK